MLATLDYQGRLRDAAQDRLAASAQTGVRSALPIARTAGRFAPSWLGGMPRGWRNVQRVESVDPVVRRGFAMQRGGKP